MSKEGMSKLKATIEDIYNTTPVLLVGSASTLFLKVWKYKVCSVSNVQELKELVDYYSLVTPSTPLVITDLAMIPASNLNVLLKLIEDAKYPIILLASYDNFNSILLSRVKTFIKFNSETLKSEFMSTRDGIKLLEDKFSSDMALIEKVKLEMKFCPKLYYMEKSLNIRRNKNKILDILS